MRVSEADLHLPTLLVIEENPGIRTGELIKTLEEIFRPQGEDAEILLGRTDTKFSQIVRNLVSHKTLTDLGYVVFSEAGEGEKHLGGSFELTESGTGFLEEHRKELGELLENGFLYEDIVDSIVMISTAVRERTATPKYIDENQVILEGTKKISSSTSYQRSAALRSAAIEHYKNTDGRIICVGCGFDFAEFYGDIGEGFIEIHHEKPLFEFAGADSAQILAEALNYVKPLCPNCHRMVHRKRENMLTIEDLRKKISDRRFS